MQKLGKQTIKFDTPPTITSTACIVGPKESNGPLSTYFDKCLDDEFWGEETWEKAESKIFVLIYIITCYNVPTGIKCGALESGG